MAERVRQVAAVIFLAAAVISAILVPLRGITPVPGLFFLTLFLVATAAKPEPGADDHWRDLGHRDDQGSRRDEPTGERPGGV